MTAFLIAYFNFSDNSMATVSSGETSSNVVQSFRYEWRITVRHCINEANFYTIPHKGQYVINRFDILR